MREFALASYFTAVNNRADILFEIRNYGVFSSWTEFNKSNRDANKKLTKKSRGFHITHFFLIWPWVAKNLQLHAG